MNESPPKRLMVLAESSSPLARGLTAARLRGPSDEELRTLERDLAAALGGGTLLGAAAGVATAKTGGCAVGAAHAWLSTGAMKLTVAIVLAAAGGAGTVAWRRSGAARGRAPAAAGPTSLAARARPTIATGPTAPAPNVAAASPAVPPSPLPRAGTAATSRSSVRAGELRSKRGVVATAGAVSANPVVASNRTPDESGLRDELSLVERAQRALPDDPTMALAFVEEHERRFAAPSLAQEREMIAVAALSRLGRTRDARARAELFIRQFPESAHVARMQRLTATPAGAPSRAR